MTIWTCTECNTKMRFADKAVPKFCSSCGGQNLSSPESVVRLKTYSNYDSELLEITKSLNKLHEQYKPLHERYTYIMGYFRQQKCRGLISENEYKNRAEKYKGLKRK